VDVAAAPGNVMIFLAEGTEAAVLRRIAEHVRPGGLLVAGFQLGGGHLSLSAYDAHATAAGFSLEARYASWDRQPFDGGDYAVSVHRLDGTSGRAPTGDRASSQAGRRSEPGGAAHGNTPS
jgi:hypothetical protein